MSFRLKHGGTEELRGDYRLWKKKLVYTFKTKHGTQANSPAGVAYPVYQEISGGDDTWLGFQPLNQGTTEQVLLDESNAN